MAGHVLSITNGTTTITLTSGDYYVTAYNIRQAEKGEDGRYQPVQEDIQLAIKGSSVGAMATNVRQLQKMLDEASRTWGDYVYLQANLMSDFSTWKARILSASLNPRDNIMSVYGNAVGEYTLTLTREPVFRGAYASASWASGGTSKSFTNGLGYQLGSLSTYVETPATIKITNSSGAARAWKRLWVANDYITGLDGANAIKIVPVDGTWSVDNDTHVEYLAEADLDDTTFGIYDPSTYQGREWRVFGCFNSATNGIELKGYTLFDVGGVHWPARTGLPATVEDGANGFVQDFGTFMIPPSGKDGANDGLSLGVSAWANGAGSIDLAYYCLMPGSSIRQYQLAYPDAYSVGSGVVLVDDPRDEGTTYLDAGTSHYPLVRATGQPIMLMPDKANRIIVLVEEDGLFEPLRTFTVTVEYEQQRLLI